MLNRTWHNHGYTTHLDITHSSAWVTSLGTLSVYFLVKEHEREYANLRKAKWITKLTASKYAAQIDLSILTTITMTKMFNTIPEGSFLFYSHFFTTMTLLGQQKMNYLVVRGN